MRAAATAARFIGLSVACSVSCGVGLYEGLRRSINDDDIYHLHSIWLVANGVLPYRQFFEVHPPGLWVLLSPWAALVEVPSHYVLTARIAIAALYGLTLWLAGRLVRVRGLQAAVLAVCGLGILYRCQVWVFRAEYVAAFCLVLHLFVLAGSGEYPRSVGRPLLAALLLALGCTISVRLLPFLLVEPALLLWWGGEQRWRHAGAWLGGMCLGVLPAVAYLTVHGLWSDMWFWAFRFVSSADVVSWRVEITGEDAALLSLGLIAAVLSFVAHDAAPAVPRAAIIAAWIVAMLFEILNPHRVFFAALYDLLTTALLLAMIPPAFGRQPRATRLVAAATLLCGLVFFVHLLPWPPQRFGRDVQRVQLAVLDWLRDVAGDEPVVAIVPHHPVTARDATDLQNAWEYALWIDSPAIVRRLRGLGDVILQQPPPLIAANPWTSHTDGMDLVDWLRHSSVIDDADAARLRALLEQRYVLVAFSGLQSEHVPPYGEQFWVRADRLAIHPPPHPYRVVSAP